MHRPNVFTTQPSTPTIELGGARSGDSRLYTPAGACAGLHCRPAALLLAHGTHRCCLRLHHATLTKMRLPIFKSERALFCRAEGEERRENRSLLPAPVQILALIVQILALIDSQLRPSKKSSQGLSQGVLDKVCNVERE